MWRRVIVRSCLLTLVVLIGVVIGLYFSLRPRSNDNQLAIGSRAAIDTLTIPLAPPVELDFLDKDAVLDLRRQAVARYPQLMAGDYEPSEVFRWIEDGRPWWGIRGQFYNGPGPNSIAGPSEESRFIMNPYLLLHAEFFGFSFYNGGRLQWNASAAAHLEAPDFPYYCPPQDLEWQPRAAHMQVSYDVSGCMARLNPYTTRPMTIADARFDLTSYNARDMNLNWIWVDYAASLNVGKDQPPAGPYKIEHYLHRGGSCGYEGGCNNMSPPSPPIDNLYLTALPARLEARLWRDEPESIGATPDMTVTIYFDRYSQLGVKSGGGGG